jgi:FtsH-binding integral membrane protein
LSPTIKSKFLWSGIGALIVAMVTDIYNFAKISVASQSIPIVIPLVLAIIGLGLIVYDFWRRNRKEEKDTAERKRERKESKWRWFPPNYR